MRDIAREAGYTQGAFYSNFQSKEDLLLDLLRQHKAQEAERITGSVATAGQDFGKAFEALEHWARDFGMDASQALLATELQLLAARNPEFGRAYAALMADQRRIYAQLLERLFALAGRTPPVPAEELAGSLMALARSQAIDHALYGAASAGDILIAVLRGLFQPRRHESGHPPSPRLAMKKPARSSRAGFSRNLGLRRVLRLHPGRPPAPWDRAACRPTCRTG